MRARWLIGCALLLLGCPGGDRGAIEHVPGDSGQRQDEPRAGTGRTEAPTPSRERDRALTPPGVRDRALTAGAAPIDPLEPVAPSLVALGRAAFWDPELSGTRDVACATCHHPDFATTDGLSLAVGTGAVGEGLARRPGPRKRFVACNAPSLFHRAGPAWRFLFFDGRVAKAEDGSFPIPFVGYSLQARDAAGALAHYPVADVVEMRGEGSERDADGRPNELGAFAMRELDAIWQAAVQRLLAIEGYRALFAAAYPELEQEQLRYRHVGDAISAYLGATFHPTDAPWDRFLRGDDGALGTDALAGAALFWGEAGCSGCHGGALLTDQAFHNLAVPKLAPPEIERQCVIGRANQTRSDADRYAHRTPPLRGVATTGPWFHNGSVASLEAVVRHHADPAASLRSWSPEGLAPDFAALAVTSGGYAEDALARLSPSLSVPALDDGQVAQLVAFLESLTSPSMAQLGALVPASVPSGLPVPAGDPAR